MMRRITTRIAVFSLLCLALAVGGTAAGQGGGTGGSGGGGGVSDYVNVGVGVGNSGARRADARATAAGTGPNGGGGGGGGVTTPPREAARRSKLDRAFESMFPDAGKNMHDAAAGYTIPPGRLGAIGASTPSREQAFEKWVREPVSFGGSSGGGRALHSFALFGFTAVCLMTTEGIPLDNSKLLLQLLLKLS